MKNTIIFILFPFLCFVVTSCNREDTSSEALTEKPNEVLREQPTISLDRILSEPGKDHFFVNPLVVAADGYVLFAEQTNVTTHLLDNNFNYVRSFVEKGPGPTEIEYITGIGRWKDKLFINDMTKGIICVYQLPEGVWLYSFSDNDLGINPGSWPFPIGNNGNLYFHRIGNEKPIIQVNQKGELIREYGEYYKPSDDEVFNQRFNRRIIEVDEDNSTIALASCAGGYIEKYSENGELLFKHDFSNMPPFDKIIEVAKELDEKSPPNYTNPIFMDMRHYGGYLFILFGYRGEKLRANSCNLLIATLSPDAFEVVEIVNLCRTSESDLFRVFRSFDIFEDAGQAKAIFSNPVNNTVEIYNLEGI